MNESVQLVDAASEQISISVSAYKPKKSARTRTLIDFRRSKNLDEFGSRHPFTQWKPKFLNYALTDVVRKKSRRTKIHCNSSDMIGLALFPSECRFATSLEPTKAHDANHTAFLDPDFLLSAHKVPQSQPSQITIRY